MLRKKLPGVALSLLLFSELSYLSVAAPAQDLPPEVIAYADIVLYGGKVLTLDSNFSTAEAIAIRGRKILAVGESDRILKMAGPKTRKIDLRGMTVVPGLIDTHYHLGDYVIASMLLKEKNIRWEGKIWWLGLLWSDAAMALRDIEKAVKASRPAEIVRVPVKVGGEAVLKSITLTQLDDISADNPVVLVTQVDARPIAVNSRALAIANLPRDVTGLPGEGILVSGKAQQLLEDYLTWAIPVETLVPWFEKEMALANSWGLTMAITRITPDQFNAVREVWLKDRITLRWRVAFPGPLDIPHTGNVSDIGDDWLRISGADGMNLGGLMHGHWSSKAPPQLQGGARWPQQREALLERLRYGWSIPNSHVKGDIAVKEILDTIEEARRNPIVRSSNQRLTMDHVPEIADEDVIRMKRLGVTPSNQVRDFFSDPSDYIKAFGADYVDRMLPIKKYLDAGIEPTIEADMGGEPLGKPLWTIEKAVCRCVDNSGRVWGMHQRVSRQDALRMKTIWAARYIGEDKKLGSLEAGKLADLVVLEKDYLSVPEDSIGEIPVALTLVDGRIVFEKNAP